VLRESRRRCVGMSYGNCCPTAAVASRAGNHPSSTYNTPNSTAFSIRWMRFSGVRLTSPDCGSSQPRVSEK